MNEAVDGNNGNNRWQWTFGLVAVGAVMVGALITFFVSTSTAGLQVASLKAQVEAVEVIQRAITDRNVLQREQLAVVDAKMIEIETQFCASDTVRNLMHASDLQATAMLWHKTFPEMIYPTDNVYYPQICNRAISTGGGALH